jgi:AraC-like DNA-binding protein
MSRREHLARVIRGPKPVRSLFPLHVKLQSLNDPRCRAVADLVRTAVAKSRRVSLEEAARIARYSPQHFSEFFHERVGVCFDTWQFALRMKHAEKLLVQKPWMPTDAISSVVGYSDVSAFSRAFKRYAGINCRQCRWLARLCPGLVDDPSGVERLDYAYSLLKLIHKDPNIASLLQQLVDHIRPSSSSTSDGSAQ